jgi:hypothetical protein
VIVRNLRPHHREVIECLTAQFGEDTRFPALIVAGSIAHGWERDDWDVDIMLRATDEVYNWCRPERAFHYFTRDFCNYPGGYVDGKIIDLAFLREVAEKASEPARAAFARPWPNLRLKRSRHSARASWTSQTGTRPSKAGRPASWKTQNGPGGEAAPR